MDRGDGLACRVGCAPERMCVYVVCLTLVIWTVFSPLASIFFGGVDFEGFEGIVEKIIRKI